eukprot:TRINITY_DN4585_c1_g1_i1.p1 TRINITY_DN4585_c1_g1~~TRINITY_DN4585_c1_g1_i1.p1  ORF type:complete len:582 (+),score=185.58 TRINITY_DN4585_c1_g1_i1:48-1793(+)
MPPTIPAAARLDAGIDGSPSRRRSRSQTHGARHLSYPATSPSEDNSAEYPPLPSGSFACSDEQGVAGSSPDGDEALPASRIEQLKATFATIDTDGSGGLTVHELRDLWVRVFPEDDPLLITDFVDQIFRDIDEDQSDEITFAELIEYLSGGKKQRPRPETVREWLWAVFEQGAAEDFTLRWLLIASNTFGLVIQLFILVSIVNMMVESMPKYQRRGGQSGNDVTLAVETTCIVLFTLEIFMRVVSCPSQKELWGSVFHWIDILAVVPYYLVATSLLSEGSGAQGLVVLRVVRMVRLVRVLRVLKLGRHSQGIQIMVIALKRSHLALTWLCMLTAMAMTLFAALIYYMEKDDCEFDFDGTICTIEDKGLCTNKWVRLPSSELEDRGKPLNQAFQSIPDSMWWVIVTLTTVGYGDAYPRTAMGKVCGGLCMMAGILVLAYPVTILTSSFSEAWEEYRTKKWRKDRQTQMIQMMNRAGDGGKSKQLAALRKLDGASSNSNPPPPPSRTSSEKGRGLSSSPVATDDVAVMFKSLERLVLEQRDELNAAIGALMVQMSAQKQSIARLEEAMGSSPQHPHLPVRNLE